MANKYIEEISRLHISSDQIAKSTTRWKKELRATSDETLNWLVFVNRDDIDSNDPDDLEYGDEYVELAALEIERRHTTNDE